MQIHRRQGGQSTVEALLACLIFCALLLGLTQILAKTAIRHFGASDKALQERNNLRTQKGNQSLYVY